MHAVKTLQNFLLSKQISQTKNTKTLSPLQMPEEAKEKTHRAIPIFSNEDTDLTTEEVELRWPRFIQYIDLTQNIGINRYIDEQNRRSP